MVEHRKSIPKLGLVDLPINSLDNDAFGLESYVNAFSEFILKCNTPLTVAIQGDWGSGKTSFMNMVKNGIAKKDKVQVEAFNTWQYSKFNLDDTLSITFLNSFANVVMGEKNRKKGKLEEILKTLTVSSLNLMTKGVISAENIDKFLKNLNVADRIYNLKSDLAEIVANSNEYERIIIFIDDLDRLAPEKAVDLLEVLQLFLSIKKCVFVIAVDYKVVIQGIKEKLGKDYSDEKAKNFFDKIIQLPFKIPLGSNDNVKNYVAKAVNEISGINNLNKEKYVSLILNSVQFNPRNIKRIINTFWLLKLVIDNDDQQSKLDSNEGKVQLALFAVICMQLAYEPVYECIVNSLRQKVDKKKLLTIDSLRDIFDQNYLNNDEIKKSKILKFVKNFIEPFSENENLLKDIVFLTKTVSNNINNNDTLIMAVSIFSSKKFEYSRIKYIILANYSNKVKEFRLSDDEKHMVIIFKEPGISSVERMNIKNLLVSNGIKHSGLYSHKYDYNSSKNMNLI